MLFDELNLSFPGEKVSVISGDSGTGKTTLLYLISGLLNPNRGKIEIAGQGIDAFTDKELRGEIISFVPVDSCEWGTTIRDSLTLGKRNISDKEIYYFLKRLDMYDFVMNMEEKLDTKIGYFLSKASAGQMQRLAIIRGILRNPKILLLDEPTSNLDEQNEELVYDLLKSLEGSMTIIIVSHRPNVKNIASKIIELP